MPDPLYVVARRALLDALEALGDHRAALILVGAQAIYVHAGEGNLASRRTRPTRTFLEALDESDDRAFDVRVAGPSALLVAKLHKLSDRAHEPGSKRLKDKDALDVMRLLRASPSVALLVRGVRSVATPIAHG